MKFQLHILLKCTFELSSIVIHHSLPGKCQCWIFGPVKLQETLKLDDNLNLFTGNFNIACKMIYYYYYCVCQVVVGGINFDVTSAFKMPKDSKV